MRSCGDSLLATFAAILMAAQWRSALISSRDSLPLTEKNELSVLLRKQKFTKKTRGNSMPIVVPLLHDIMHLCTVCRVLMTGGLSRSYNSKHISCSEIHIHTQTSPLPQVSVCPGRVKLQPFIYDCASWIRTNTQTLATVTPNSDFTEGFCILWHNGHEVFQILLNASPCLHAVKRRLI